MNDTAGLKSLLSVVVFSIAFATFLSGCASRSDERGDFPGDHQHATALSPDQCDANARIVAASADETSYRIQPGDVLDVDFYLNPEFNDEVTVRPDGKVAMRLVGSEQAAGLTPDQLAKNLDTAYLTELRDPGVSVHVKDMPSREVYVEGRVTKPGAVPLQPGMTALQAISDAGGLQDDAGDNKVVLIRRDMCGVPHAMKLDLASAAAKDGSDQDAALMPKDVIVVPRSNIGNMDLFVAQYIRNMLPVSPYIGIPF